MPRKRRWWRNRPGKYQGGQVIVNRKDYTIRDYMSPGRLAAWAEWIPHQKGEDKQRQLPHPIEGGACKSSS